MSEEITQQKVDDAVAEARADWAKLVEDSGKTQSEFIASRGLSTELLLMFSEFKDMAIKEGFSCPDIIEGVTVTVVDSNN